MKDLKDKVVVITGAGSGIGRALAENLAGKGCRLALTDVRKAGLDETRNLLGLSKQDVMCSVVDVSDHRAMTAFSARVAKRFNQVDIVINNAGIGSHGSFEEQDIETMHRLIDVNMWGVVYGCRAFLPYLKERPESSLVNVSSINGVVPFPENAPYNMSKYAVLGLNETLLMELKDTSVQLLSVHPGFINTNIANFGIGQTDEKKAAFEKIAFTSPAQAASQIVRAIKSRRDQVFVGVDAKLLQALKRINANAALGVSDFLVRGLGRWLS